MHSLIWGGRGAVTALRLLRPTAYIRKSDRCYGVEREPVGQLEPGVLHDLYGLHNALKNPLAVGVLGMHTLISGGRGAVTALRLLRPTINGLRFTTGSGQGNCTLKR